MNVLLITENDIKSRTRIDGNTDSENFISSMIVAQDVYLEPILGTDFMNRYKTMIQDDTLDSPVNSDYKELLNNYIKPLLIKFFMMAYLPVSAYQYSNSGVTKHTSDNIETVDSSDVDKLVNQETALAKHYEVRLLHYLCHNDELFPEYEINEDGKTSPRTTATFTGWFI